MCEWRQRVIAMKDAGRFCTGAILFRAYQQSFGFIYLKILKVLKILACLLSLRCWWETVRAVNYHLPNETISCPSVRRVSQTESFNESEGRNFVLSGSLFLRGAADNQEGEGEWSLHITPRSPRRTLNGSLEAPRCTWARLCHCYTNSKTWTMRNYSQALLWADTAGDQQQRVVTFLDK